MKLIAFDAGLHGAYACFMGTNYEYCESMPTYKIITQEKLLQFDLDDKGKKQVIKSGPNKGNFKTKVRRPEKTKLTLNMEAILEVMSENDVVLIERQNPRPGNSAQSSFTTGINYGKLLACAELSGAKVEIVSPHVWKKIMKLSQDKLESVELAEKLTGKLFRTERGRLLHDKAEAVLLGYYYIKGDIK